jgi:PKD domain
MGRQFRITVTLAALALAMLVIPATASATPPPNDDFANATVISSLPFTDSQDLSTATTEPGEPLQCGASQTNWYQFTPTSDVVVRATSTGSNFFSTNINVFRADGPGFGGLTWLGCGQFGNQIVFQAHAGQTYYIQGGNIFGGFGTLQINLNAVPPPPNDNFANAIPFSSVPFTDSEDITGATTEPGEPTSSCAGQFIGTDWYAFTPTTSGSYSTSTTFGFQGDVDVYTGSSLQNLTRVACGGVGGLGTWHADAGTTYYLQAGTFFETGQLPIQVEQTPAPAVGFVWGPGDPSIFDTISFFATSFDPANIGIQTHSWDFGDGTTATGCCPTHQFAKDGDYSVTLTDTTFDGRTNSATNVIQVRTHDVAITSFLAPSVGNVGKTAQFVARLSNSRYPEQVRVDLMKSDPTNPFGGLVTVASLTQAVPVGRAGKTTDFKMNYTFTSADATLGKVTFEAVATILGARDAFPADNTAIAPPTRVMP